MQTANNGSDSALVTSAGTTPPLQQPTPPPQQQQQWQQQQQQWMAAMQYPVAAMAMMQQQQMMMHPHQYAPYNQAHYQHPQFQYAAAYQQQQHHQQLLEAQYQSLLRSKSDLESSVTLNLDHIDALSTNKTPQELFHSLLQRDSRWIQQLGGFRSISRKRRVLHAARCWNSGEICLHGARHRKRHRLASMRSL